MTWRNQKKVLCYYEPNKHLYPEKFGYHLLLLSYLFANESDLFSNDMTYSGKFQEPILCARVNENNQVFEPNSELIDTLPYEISIQEKEKHCNDDQQDRSYNE